MKYVDDKLIIPDVPATDEAIAGIQIGDMVRIKINAAEAGTERFWVEVTLVTDTFVRGTCEAIKM